MSTTLIQDILKNGESINDELGKKIELLATRNSNFNQQLTKRLNDIIAVIDAFKSTNLQGLTETKNKLTSVTNELETTKANLQQTQNELERICSTNCTFWQRLFCIMACDEYSRTYVKLEQGYMQMQNREELK